MEIIIWIVICAIIAIIAVIAYSIGYKEGLEKMDLMNAKEMQKLDDIELLDLHLSTLEEIAKRVNVKKANEENPFEEFNGGKKT